jgi:DNA-binding NarL/FixJ family response regulator
MNFTIDIPPSHAVRPPFERDDHLRKSSASMLAERPSISCNFPQETATRLHGPDVPRSGEIRVLISHSDALISAGLEAVLQKRRGLKVVFPRFASEFAHDIDSESAEADVVIADYESALRLSEGSRKSASRLLILTHSDSEARICRALERGARGYLLLGCSPDDLVDGIHSVFQGGVALGPQVARRIAENMAQQALTAREESVLRQLMLGLSNKRIALKFTLTEGTVKAHVKSILAKLNAASRTEAIAIAHRRGLLPYESEGSKRQTVVREQLNDG